MADDVLPRLRGICLALPETSERISHGTPAFFVRARTVVVTFVDDHHGDGLLAIWCAAPPGAQAELVSAEPVSAEPGRFFVPPYVGHRGWLGVRLDRDLDWDEVAGIVREAYRQVAPQDVGRPAGGVARGGARGRRGSPGTARSAARPARVPCALALRGSEAGRNRPTLVDRAPAGD